MEGEELKARIKSVIESDCEIFVNEYPNEKGDMVWYAILNPKKMRYTPIDDGKPVQCKWRVDGDSNVPHDNESLINKFTESVYNSIQKGRVKIDDDRPKGFGFTSIKTYEEIQQTEK